jgi:hypothetical protein
MAKYDFKKLILDKDLNQLSKACARLATVRVKFVHKFPEDLFNWDSRGQDRSGLYEELGSEYLYELVSGNRLDSLGVGDGKLSNSDDWDGLIIYDFDLFLFGKIRQCSKIVGNKHRQMRAIVAELQREGLMVKQDGYCHFLGSDLPAGADDLLRCLETVPQWKRVVYREDSSKTSPLTRDPDMRNLVLALIAKAPGNVSDTALFLAILDLLGIRPYRRVEAEVSADDSEPINIIDQYCEGGEPQAAIEKLEIEADLRLKLESLCPLDGEIIAMFRDGWEKTQICAELGLTKDQLNRRIKSIKQIIWQ